MKKIITIIFAVLLLFGVVFAEEELNFTQAMSIIDNKTNCNNLSLDQLEQIGDYYMEQMHPGSAHEVMDDMMGGEGSVSLSQMHISMADRFYCSQFDDYNSNYNYGGYSMMGGNMMGGRGMMYDSYYDSSNSRPYNNGYSMKGYLSPFGVGGFGIGILMIIFWILIIVLIIVLIKSLSNKKELKSENSLDIAKKRYAKGEITKKEFDEIKKDLK